MSREKLDLDSLRRGFLIGITYSTGLLLQGAGTYYIDPSVSAFITGLSTIHVHIYRLSSREDNIL